MLFLTLGGEPIIKLIQTNCKTNSTRGRLQKGKWSHDIFRENLQKLPKYKFKIQKYWLSLKIVSILHFYFKAVSLDNLLEIGKASECTFQNTRERVRSCWLPRICLTVSIEIESKILEAFMAIWFCYYQYCLLVIQLYFTKLLTYYGENVFKNSSFLTDTLRNIS